MLPHTEDVSIHGKPAAHRLRAVVPYLTLASLVLPAHVGVAAIVGARGWDDGAITVAFARTFGHTGIVSLTPFSESVEGFSSPFWLLLLAATIKLLDLGFYGSLSASQLWSAAFATTACLLTYRLTAPRLGQVSAWLCSLALFGAVPFLSETMNGMEMSALAVVALLIASMLRTRADGFSWLVFSLAFVGPFVRLEAAGYLVGGAIGLFGLSRSKKAATTIAAGAITSVAVMTLVRLSAFGYWLPNTMRAKQWPPYSGAFLADRIGSSLSALVEITYLLAPSCAFALGALLLSWRCLRRRASDLVEVARSRVVPPVASYALCYVGIVIAFNVAIGKTWGYAGRLELSAVGLVFILVTTVVWGHHRRVTVATAALVICTIVVSCSAAIVGSSHGLEWTKLRTAVAGGEDWSTVTPAGYRPTGIAADRVRVLLRKPSLAFMTPDVGGTSLCCTRLNIIDMAMLANTQLAKEGYRRFDWYLQKTSPDLIEVHGDWAQLSGIYRSRFFVESYSPIVVHDTWFYLRRDRLVELSYACTAIPTRGTESLRYRGGDPRDEGFVKSLAQVRVCAL